MQVSVQTKEVILTSRQKSYIEKKLGGLKRYYKTEVEAISVTAHFLDDNGTSKGGYDQLVKIDFEAPSVNFHAEEQSTNMMKAFNKAFAAIERQIREDRKKQLKSHKRDGSRLEKVFGILKIGRKKDNK